VELGSFCAKASINMTNYLIKDDYGGVPDGDQYEIPDTSESESEWRVLLSAFAKEFSGFVVEDEFEFADWHHNRRSIAAYLYDERFYNEDFLPKVQAILRNQKYPSFAEFECYDAKLRMLGLIMVFKDNIIFNRLSEQRGLLSKLIPKQK
jgi:hypothetical protein